MIARFDVFAEHQLEQDRGFEHPRHRRPELLNRHAQRMHTRVWHCVWADFCEAAVRLVARQTTLQG